MRKFKRSERVADQIMREVSALVDTATSDGTFGMVSVTDVTLTDDLRYAKIFVSCLELPREGPNGLSRDSADPVEHEAVTYLNSRRKKIRTELARRINIKFVPEISFEYDPSIERGMRIESILKEIAEKRADSSD